MNLLSRTLTAALLLTVLVAGISAQRSQRSIRANSARRPQPAASPSPGVLLSSEQWQIDDVEPVEAIRGERVTVTGKFPEKLTGIEVVLNKIEVASAPATRATPTPTPTSSTPCTKTMAATTGRLVNDAASFAFVVPPCTRLGRYSVIVKFSQGGKKYEPVTFLGGQSGAFKIITREPVEVAAVYPGVTYADKKLFSFTVLGKGFSPFPEDNSLDIEGRPNFKICQNDKEEGCGKIEVSRDARELTFSGIPYKKYGPLKVRVRVGDELSGELMPVTLSWVSKQTPLLIAILFSVALLALIYFILSGRKAGMIRRRSYSLFEAVFLDKQTNTYSLSKLEFYAWTFSGIFGYVYLTVARSSIQGELSFPEPPENLASLLLISVSTGALATGITNSRGSKGAGEENPSIADFITTGGVVAAERLQFFVWTVVGVIAFIVLIVLKDPGVLVELPKIPDGFLYLMGVSSFGYLGGKLTRKPGPVITQIAASLGSLSLEIHGKNLSQDATFRIDDIQILADQLDQSICKQGRPKVELADEQTEFAKVLRLVIEVFNPEWLKGEHILTLINGDGQRAAWTFEVTTPTITSIVPNIGLLDGGDEVSIIGTNFSEGATVTFGGVLAQSAEVVSATSISAVTPPHGTEEPVEVVVKNSDGASATMPGGFTYTAAIG